MKKGTKACFAGLLIAAGAVLCMDSAFKEGWISTDGAGATNAAAFGEYQIYVSLEKSGA